MRQVSSIALLACIILLISGCPLLDKLTQFEFSHQETIIVEAFVPMGGLVKIPTPPVTTSSYSEFDAHNTRTDLVEEVKLTQLTLTIVSPKSGDFNFLEELKIYIEAEAEGLAEKEIAYTLEIADNSTQLSLETSGIDLTKYIQAESFQLRVKLTTDELIDEDHEILVDARFFVDAKILGI